jgi:hypothetical protein
MIFMARLAIVTLVLLWSGDRTLPQVRDFNWQNRSIGAEDTAFTLTFNRTIDRTAAAMVQYNSDYTKSLFVITNQGAEQQVFKTNGSILDAIFFWLP